MKNLGYALLVASLVLLAAGGASSAVDITWTDATGGHTVSLACTYNSWDYDPTAFPPDVDPEYVWFGVVDVAMSTYPIVFHVSGNFWGGENTYDVWDQVRIEQHVTNLTPCKWKEFDVDLLNDDGWMYKCAGVQAHWSANVQPSYAHFKTLLPQYYTPIGGQFYDELVYWANVLDYGVGDGTMTFQKKPICYVPEVGGLAVLLSGGTGLLGYFIRKRRG